MFYVNIFLSMWLHNIHTRAVLVLWFILYSVWLFNVLVSNSVDTTQTYLIDT